MSNLKIFLTNENNLAILSIDSQAITISKFKPIFGKTLLLIESLEILLGTQYKSPKNIDPFAKPDYYELGAKLAGAIKDLNLDSVSLEKTIELTSKQLLDLQLGFDQAYYSFDKYLKSSKGQAPKFLLGSYQEFFLEGDAKKLNSLKKAMREARKIMDDTPYEVNPSTVEKIVRDRFDNHTSEFVPLGSSQNGIESEFKINFYDHNWIKEQKLNGVWTVGKASSNKPVVVHTVIRTNKNAKNTRKVVLIGKGLCFDTGGYNIKVAGAMSGMKYDMCGSGTAFGSMLAIKEFLAQRQDKKDYTQIKQAFSLEKLASLKIK